MSDLERDESFFETARKRWKLAREFWEPIYDEFDIDMRYATGDQWDPNVKNERQEIQNKPTLTFDVLHTNVQLVVNQIRQNKPGIQIAPEGAGAEKADAEVKEGIIRHWDYKSQADIARDNAIYYATAGSIGFYRVKTKYVYDDPDVDESLASEQEFATEWIRDPKKVYWDPKAIESPVFDTGKYCFIIKRMPWDEYYEENGEDAEDISWSTFDSGGIAISDWASKDEITVAEYWSVEEKEVKKYGRTFKVRTVHQDIFNGVRSLRHTVFPADWIPILVCLGEQSVVSGKTILASLIRYVRDAAKLRNAFKSGIALQIGLTGHQPLLGPRGTFKGPGWMDMHLKNPATMEWDLVYDKNGNLVNGSGPARPQYEAAIQSLMEAANAENDDIKAGMGIYDSSLGAAKAEYSGVSVDKRTEQANVTNYHFGDNLNRIMWHEGRIKLQLLDNLIDTPRAVNARDASGQVSEALIAVAGENGQELRVAGREGEKHHRLDQGRFSPAVTTGPSFATQREKEYSLWMQFLAQAPELAPAFLPVILRWSNTPGADKLADVATAMAPPAVQAVLNGNQPIPPEAQAHMAQATQMVQELQGKVQQLEFEKKAELQKLTMQQQTDIQNNAVKIAVAEISSKSKEAVALVQEQYAAAAQMLAHTQELISQFHQGSLDQQAQQQQLEAQKQAQASDQAHQAGMQQDQNAAQAVMQQQQPQGGE